MKTKTMKTTIPSTLLAIALATIGIHHQACAQDPSQLPPDLVQAKTGAYWEEGQKSGFVRFSSFERGFEHVHHQIVIEWTVSPSAPNEKLTVLSRVIVKDIPDTWSVGEAKFETIFVRTGEKRFIEFPATNTYSHEKAKFSIELLGVGKIAVTKLNMAEHRLRTTRHPPRVEVAGRRQPST